jgi:hypothetical protein
MTECRPLAPKYAKDLTLPVSGPKNTSCNAQHKSQIEEHGNWQIQQLIEL